MISIKGLDKVEVLQALYARARPQGMGMLHFVPGPLYQDEAEDFVRRQSYFNYLKGRVMKVDISKDELDERLYDRDNGDGAAQEALLDLLTRPKIL